MLFRVPIVPSGTSRRIDPISPLVADHGPTVAFAGPRFMRADELEPQGHVDADADIILRRLDFDDRVCRAEIKPPAVKKGSNTFEVALATPGDKPVALTGLELEVRYS